MLKQANHPYPPGGVITKIKSIMGSCVCTLITHVHSIIHADSYLCVPGRMTVSPVWAVFPLHVTPMLMSILNRPVQIAYSTTDDTAPSVTFVMFFSQLHCTTVER